MKRWFKNRIPSLREKLILPMLAAALIPMTVFMCVVTLTINRSNTQAGKAEADKLLRTLASEIYALEANVSSTAQTLVTSPSVKKIYRSLSEGVSLSEELDFYRLLSETVMLSTMVDDFYRIRMYLPDSQLLTREQTFLFSVNDLPDEKLPENMRHSAGRSGWTDWELSRGQYYSNNEVMLKSYWISSAVKGKEGGELYVAVDISLSSLQHLMSAHNEILCEYSLYNQRGERLLHYGTAVNAPEQWRYRAQMELSDGTLLCVETDLSQFTSDISQYLSLLLHISLLCVILIPCATLLVLSKQCRELEKLAAANLQMAEGDLRLIGEDACTREVRTIQRTHNEMVSRIDDLIHNVYEEQIEKQEAQLNCLFEQIKPHFLYNTLESGKWMALREGDQRTAKFLEKLAKYFRVRLGGGMDQVPLRSELEHIRLYVELINMRLSKQISLEISVAQEILDYPVLRMLLQPLVENAVEHGICALEGPVGTVRIIAEPDGDDLLISVENDGIEIPAERLDEVNGGSSGGIGISNIRSRLKLFYGDGCGLLLENLKGGGVRTTIHIRRNAKQSIVGVKQ